MERRPPPAPARPLMQRMPFGRDGDVSPSGPEFRPRMPGPDSGFHSDPSHPQNPMEKMQPTFREPFLPQRPPLLQVHKIHQEFCFCVMNCIKMHRCMSLNASMLLIKSLFSFSAETYEPMQDCLKNFIVFSLLM